MFRRLNARYNNNFCKFPHLINSAMKEEKIKKPFKECIYNSSKLSNNNNLNINFKNQKAFFGYRKSQIDLYKSFCYLIILI